MGEMVAAGCRFSFFSLGSTGFLGIGPVGVDLSLGRHLDIVLLLRLVEARFLFPLFLGGVSSSDWMVEARPS